METSISCFRTDAEFRLQMERLEQQLYKVVWKLCALSEKESTGKKSKADAAVCGQLQGVVTLTSLVS